MLDTRFIGKGAFESMDVIMTVVQRVVALWRYPVKSMAAERPDGIEIGPAGPFTVGAARLVVTA